MEEKDGDPSRALESFLCFLYVGKEHSYYKAKPWNDDDYYSQGKRMRSLEILASNKKTELVPLDKIKLAMDSKLIQRPETLMFALAMCARQKKSEKLRAAAYYFLTEHCKDWRYFILFIKYASYLCRIEDSNSKKEEKHIGWGRGWKNAVNKWYLSHNATDLAILVGQHKGGYGWKHKDILRLSHMDTQNLDVEKRVVVKYALDGLEDVWREFRDDPEAKNQLLYLTRVDKFRACQNPKIVASELLRVNFTIDHVHPKALKSTKIWEILSMRIDIRTALKYLPKLSQLGLLTKLSRVTERIVRILTDENNIRWNKVLPTEILAVLNLYEEAPSIFKPYRSTLNALETEEGDTSKNNFKFSFESINQKPAEFSAPVSEFKIKETKKNEKKKTKSVRSGKKPVRIKAPNMRIRDALRTALSIARTVDITGSSKKSYLVAVRLPAGQGKNSCSEAGLAIALPLLHRANLPENATTIIGYEPQMGIGSPAKITKDMSYDEALKVLIVMKKNRGSWKAMPLGPLVWCYTEKGTFDVFINVTNEPPHRTSIDLIRAWKKVTNSPDTRFFLQRKVLEILTQTLIGWDCTAHKFLRACERFVNVIVSRGTFELKGDIWHQVLTINGFDQHVPWIIEAYVRGLF